MPRLDKRLGSGTIARMDGTNPYAPPARDPAPIGPALASGPAGSPIPWTISEVLNVGFNGVRQRPIELIGGFFLVNLLSQIPTQLPNVLLLSEAVGRDSVAALVLQILSVVGGVIVGSFFWVGQLRVALAAARGEPFEFGLFFSGGDRLLTMLVTSVLIGIGVMFGMVLLIVPGVVLSFGLALAAPFVVDAGSSAVESLRESWEAMRGHKMQMFLFSLVAVLLCVAGMCACYVGLFVVLPAIAIAYAEIYRRITGRMLGGSVEEAADFEQGLAGASWMRPPV